MKTFFIYLWYFTEETTSVHDDEPAVTISHHALPPTTVQSRNGGKFNGNSSVHYHAQAHTNELMIDDDLSSHSQPGVIIEHLGPGSALPQPPKIQEDPYNVTAISTDSRTLLINQTKPQQNGTALSMRNSSSERVIETVKSPVWALSQNMFGMSQLQFQVWSRGFSKNFCDRKNETKLCEKGLQIKF